ncbi:fumarylacetoacetase [Edaphobacter flagellatus]|uniref:fumarylacetoacetase n=1 Tax=Edaphobacter flagellatus TaxID=1933044 RepID=UPI0021B1F1B5|nr:fumarylacetoacetase [Edaphobacter flagellatus]
MAVIKESWVVSANHPDCDFPLDNLPYGVFSHIGGNRIGIAIGDQILDLRGCAESDMLSGLPQPVIAACRTEHLNGLMSLGPASWSVLRRKVNELLSISQTAIDRIATLLIPMQQAAMQLPAQIGDYTDFYASIDHATRVGLLLRPDNPLLPNYKYVPIGYHGRASSIVISGTEITRPSGQIKSADSASPAFGPTQSLDYELEVGCFIGTGNALGQTIPIAEAEQHIFGLCLVNDWSARDMQSWEYQPLGPFLAKNFATTISPWIIPLEALAPYRTPARIRSVDDPATLPYLSSSSVDRDGIDLTLEVYLQSEQMRIHNEPPIMLSRGNLRTLYWTIAQLLTHHASNGCNLRPGDLIATGTVSGPDEGSEGCLLEMKHRKQSIRLPTGETRTFLADGDTVVFRAYSYRPGFPRIGFGECSGTVNAPVRT